LEIHEESAMAEPARIYMSEDEFFEFLKTAEGRFELVDGEMTMMAGANQRHQDIAANTLATLHAQLRGGKCRPTAADTAVTTNGNVRYPDVVVDCGRRNDQSVRATTPTLVIEVLSQSTRLFDSHKKLNEYKSHPDIKYIVLVDTDSARALLHYRDGAGWRERVYEDLNEVIEFPEIGASLALSDVYYGLEIKPKLAPKRTCPKCGMDLCACDGSGFSP
jgi:Uma2 family endonuclease